MAFRQRINDQKYSAFISYSHAADGELAAALQYALHRFAKPWYQMRAMRIFRDKTGLSVTPALWPSIEKALSESHYFLLLASRQAARSRWVEQEIDWWLSNRSAAHLLIIWTDGQIEWNRDIGDFDWAVTDALPARLKNIFPEEPHHLDVRWIKNRSDLSPRHPEFQKAISGLAATLRNQPLDELVGQDVTEHSKLKRAAVLGLSIICLLMVASVIAAILAYRQRNVARQQANIAREQANIAFSRELSANATQAISSDVTLSLALATRALDIAKTTQAEDALRNSLATYRIVRVTDCCKGRLVSAAFSPNQKWIITVHEDGTAIIRDAHTWAKSVELGPHPRIYSAAFSPDSQRVVTAGGDDHRAIVWETTTGRKLLEVRGHKKDVTNAEFSPDAHQIVTASADGTAKIWDTQTGRSIRDLRGHSVWVNGASFSPDGRRIVTAGGSASRRAHTLYLFSTPIIDNTARVWDATTGRESVALKGHSDAVMSAVFSPSGDQILTASGDQTARLWDTTTARTRLILRGHSAAVSAAAFSPDGRRVATASDDHTVCVWDVATGKKLFILRGHSDAVKGVTFSPDGQWVLSASSDGTARVWDASLRIGVVGFDGHVGSVTSAALRRDNRLALTRSDDGTARTWSTATGEAVTEVSCGGGSVVSAEFSQDGTLALATCNDRRWVNRRSGFVQIWNAETGKLLADLFGHGNDIKHARFSEDGKFVITASADKTARVWEVATGRTLVELRGHDDEVTDASFSADGKLVATASRDRTGRLWDVATGKCLFTLGGHPGPVSSIAFSPSGAWVFSVSELPLFGRKDGTLRVWDVATGHLMRTLGEGDFVEDGEFGPNTKWVLTRGSGDDGPQAWDIVGGHMIARLRGRQTDIRCCASFSSDGKYVATANSDSTVRVWRVATGEGLVELRENGGISALAFSVDGKWLLTGGHDRSAKLYPRTLFAPLDELLEVARSVVRPLTARERANYLHEPLQR